MSPEFNKNWFNWSKNKEDEFLNIFKVFEYGCLTLDEDQTVADIRKEKVICDSMETFHKLLIHWNSTTKYFYFPV